MAVLAGVTASVLSVLENQVVHPCNNKHEAPNSKFLLKFLIDKEILEFIL